MLLIKIFIISLNLIFFFLYLFYSFFHFNRQLCIYIVLTSKIFYDYSKPLYFSLVINWYESKLIVVNELCVLTHVALNRLLSEFIFKGYSWTKIALHVPDWLGIFFKHRCSCAFEINSCLWKSDIVQVRNIIKLINIIHLITLMSFLFLLLKLIILFPTSLNIFFINKVMLLLHQLSWSLIFDYLPWSFRINIFDTLNKLCLCLFFLLIVLF